MDEEEATRTCGQCHKEVAEANFALHETHCSRFLCVCPDCEETVPRDQLEEHREEQHTQVRCTKCRQRMERCQLKDHELDECVERLESCTFCELELPWREQAEHRLACGSRTERCLDCGRYVTLKDQAEHQLTCTAGRDDDPASGRARAAEATERNGREAEMERDKPSFGLKSQYLTSSAKITVGCSYCGSTFSSDVIEEHEMNCVHASSRWDTKNSEPERRRRREDEDELSGEEANPQLSQALKSHFMSHRPSRAGWGGGDRGDEDPHQLGSCPHCHLALPLSTLRWHEAKCRLHLHLRH